MVKMVRRNETSTDWRDKKKKLNPQHKESESKGKEKKRKHSKNFMYYCDGR